MVTSAAAPRSMWNGTIAFGLVNVPVKLVAAVRQERISFHMLHDQDHVRLTMKMVNPTDGKEVHPEHRVKGFEVAPEQYVVMKEDEIAALKPAKSKAIDIEAFVKPDEIDARMYDRPYYLLPGENAAKNYHLLLTAMANAGRVAIARFVMRDKEYLAAIRPVGGVLGLDTMRYAEEIVEAGDAEWPGGGVKTAVKIADRELTMAEQLIDSLAGTFDPGAYRNEYVDKVKELIAAKVRGEEVELPEPVTPKATAGRSLADVLAASLKHVKAGKGRAEAGERDDDGEGEERGRALVTSHHRSRPTTKKK